MKYPEPQQMLGLRAMGKKGLDAYEEVRSHRNHGNHRNFYLNTNLTNFTNIMTITKELLEKLFEEAKGTFGSRFFAEQSGKAERMINGSRL